METSGDLPVGLSNLANLTKNLKEDLIAYVLEIRQERERVVLVSYDVSVFRHPGYPSASPHVLASPKTLICEVSKWQCVVKSRLMDEILLEDPRSVMTVRFEGET